VQLVRLSNNKYNNNNNIHQFNRGCDITLLVSSIKPTAKVAYKLKYNDSVKTRKIIHNKFDILIIKIKQKTKRRKRHNCRVEF
jgi:hypothetical protein